MALGGSTRACGIMARWTARRHLLTCFPRDAKESGPVRRATLREAMMHPLTWTGCACGDRADRQSFLRDVDWVRVASCSRTADLDRVVWHNGGTEGYLRRWWR